MRPLREFPHNVTLCYTYYMKTLIITPPVVQFNSPYPSGAYLKAFFTHAEGGGQSADDVRWYDLNIRLFYSVFSAQGLCRLFELSEAKALQLAAQAEAKGDDDTAFNLRRYITQKNAWIKWIDFITAVLAGDSGISGREKAHQFLYSPFAPRASRMENFLAGLDHEPTVDDVRFLCTFALADLSDYITVAFDPQFSLVRYAESLAVDTRSFSDFEKEIDSPVMEHFYKPLLEDIFKDFELPAASGGRAFRCSADAPAASLASLSPVAACGAATIPKPSKAAKEPGAQVLPKPDNFLVCISIPFAGTFLPALYTARWFKQNFGDKAFVCIGGGFVNTELREARDPALAKYINAISYDRGYGSYRALLGGSPVKPWNDSSAKPGNDSSANPGNDSSANPGLVNLSLSGLTGQSLYKMRLFATQPDGSVKITEPLWSEPSFEKYENEITAKIIPDYSDIDFSIYPRMCDDRNAMHRIWTDGCWIKAYLAHGCYWHKCAFCDTSLDYVCGYKPTDTAALYKGLLQTARQKGLYGIHFVDEALPPAALRKFALLNAREGNPLYFWGNVRFEKSFTKDLAAFLSYCGLGGVSAGIESATGKGLEAINKGTDITSITQACCAFKEAGILVHAYMIYGFWNDTAQSIIDSMETLRQFFAAGLLDSAFWHKFVLTRNSTVYSQWEKDGTLDLVCGEESSSAFARNNLHFKGEEKFNKFGPALDSAVNAWMHGERLDMKVQKWFDFQLPAATVPRDFIDHKIEEYEKKSAFHLTKEDFEKSDEEKGIFWLGGNAVKCGQGKASELRWIYLQEECYLSLENLPKSLTSNIIISTLNSLSPSAAPSERLKCLNHIKKDDAMQKILGRLHNKGVVNV